jgi:hypothetical protein
MTIYHDTIIYHDAMDLYNDTTAMYTTVIYGIYGDLPTYGYLPINYCIHGNGPGFADDCKNIAKIFADAQKYFVHV